MAEFQEVMRQMVRLHQSCTCGCFIPGTEELCPLYGVNDGLCDWINATPKMPVAQIENVVMSWAAENPETVYPTWEEWLLDNGVFAPDNVLLNGKRRFYLEGKPVLNIPTKKIYDRIPADIAEKLGIEPKEKE